MLTVFSWEVIEALFHVRLPLVSGEELSKKQAAQESTIRKLRAQIRDLDEEKKALAEARANNEARTELDRRLREAEERESMLVQALEELRQTLSKKEHQAVFKEDILLRDIEDLQKRYQGSERQCEELITQVPESTRPLLRKFQKHKRELQEALMQRELLLLAFKLSISLSAIHVTQSSWFLLLLNFSSFISHINWVIE